MNKTQFLKHIDELGVWQRRGQRAPHKPLLLLMMISRALRGETGMVEFGSIEQDLENLLIDFGPPRSSYHPEQPFFYLKNDGIWELSGLDRVTIRKGSSNPTRKSMRDQGLQGGLTKTCGRLLTDRPAVAVAAARKILQAHFPETLHGDILMAVGIDPELLEFSGKRSARFREMVLEAYRQQCAVCRYDLRLGRALIGLEAAHIRWHQAAGPDVVPNGLALCSLHHKLFDSGAFTIDNNQTVVISPKASGSVALDPVLRNFANEPIAVPDQAPLHPKNSFLTWHRREVFKSDS